MEKYTIAKDIKLICKIIPTFPRGIKEGFEELIAKFGAGKSSYAISYMDKDGNIVYKAAVPEPAEGDAVKHGYEPFTLAKGDYLSETIRDWMPKTDKIKEIFGQLMKDPRFDDTYPCVEIYKDEKEMQCMVRIK